MTYNLLADSLLNLVDYGDVNPEHLKWITRQKQIQKEIEYLKPDILCLQEHEYESGIHDYLIGTLGMKGEYLKKEEDAKKDGCAIMYNPKKFTQLHKLEVPYNMNRFSQLYQKP